MRWNDKLDQLIQCANVVGFIKTQRIRSLGHMTRMDDLRAQIKAMDANSFNILLTEPHRKNEFREKVLSLKGLVLTGRANTANGYSFSKSFEKSF